MSKKTILIDTGAANIHSVHKAFKYIGANVEITSKFSVIESGDSIVFPGVGAFSAVMENVESKKLVDPIRKSIESKKPFLGICVGLQVLFEESEEHGYTKGIGVLKGKVVKFKKAKKVPHIGWNNVTWTTDSRQQTADNRQEPSVIRDQLSVVSCPLSPSQYYFVHSYYVTSEDESIVFGETEYDGEKFISAVKKDNLIAVQFHPEKSGDAGLEFLKQFVSGNL